MYAAANRILGNIVKVTPSSKVVGDLALALVGAGADPADFEENPTKFDIPDSVIGFLEGELGDPPGGWPEPFRTKALQGRQGKPRVTELTPRAGGGARRATRAPRSTSCSSRARPRTTSRPRERFGDLSVLGTVEFLHGLDQGREYEVEIEAGKRLLLGVSSIGDADAKGMRTVMCTLNGQFRPITVRDSAIQVDVKAAEKAEPGNPAHVPAPFAGVVTPAVAEGDTVEAGRRRRDHRGDEDGGQHHRTQLPARSSAWPSAVTNRSRAGTFCSSSRVSLKRHPMRQDAAPPRCRSLSAQPRRYHHGYRRQDREHEGRRRRQGQGGHRQGDRQRAPRGRGPAPTSPRPTSSRPARRSRTRSRTEPSRHTRRPVTHTG